jgi:hypothetical protein
MTSILFILVLRFEGEVKQSSPCKASEIARTPQLSPKNNQIPDHILSTSLSIDCKRSTFIPAKSLHLSKLQIFHAAPSGYAPSVI